MDAANRVAIITGASRGLGETLAGFLARQGWGVVLTARGADALDAVGRELRAINENVIAVAGDIADSAHRANLVAAARDLGGLDLLVNNASVLGPSPLPALVDADLDALTETYRVNTAAQLGMIQAALPLLKDRRGLVINISSDAARGGYEGWGVYGASKAALDLLSLTLANELRPDGVSVVAVDPGDMNTQLNQEAYPGEDISDRPLPQITLPFWAWLIGQDWAAVSGQRFEAQGQTWEVAYEA